MCEVQIYEARRFMIACLVAAGAPDTEAKKQVELLLHADVCGHYSHGINRLEFYINDIKTGATDPNATPRILKESAATAWVDGCNVLGATSADFCMNVAIEKAKNSGVGWVSAKACNHFGMAGYWALKAEKQGLIGLAFTNSSPVLVPTRAKKAALGTNPIAMAAPASNGDSLVVDMAMTTVALGKIEVQVNKGENIPYGWAFGSDGNVTTDANEALKAGRLLPLGGFEETSGYKGYGLSAMVEAFCSGLSGAAAAHTIPPWSPTREVPPPNLGQCFIAIDPQFFAPSFAERTAECLQHYRGMEPVNASLPILAPGDKEKLHAQATKNRGTIIYPKRQIDKLHDLAKILHVDPISIT